MFNTVLYISLLISSYFVKKDEQEKRIFSSKKELRKINDTIGPIQWELDSLNWEKKMSGKK